MNGNIILSPSIFGSRVNPQTGANEPLFRGVLRSIAAKPRTTNTENKTLYRGCSVQFVNAKGEEKVVFGLMWESNYEYGVAVGDELLCTARKTENPPPGFSNVLVLISHLPAGGFAEEDDFVVGGNWDKIFETFEPREATASASEEIPADEQLVSS